MLAVVYLLYLYMMANNSTDLDVKTGHDTIYVCVKHNIFQLILLNKTVYLSLYILGHPELHGLVCSIIVCLKELLTQIFGIHEYLCYTCSLSRARNKPSF